jgi:hypothetical protein
VSLFFKGNPLSCDCDSLWLRNLAADTSTVADEPKCYFPKELSGSPLRKLRSSRFSCETSRSGAEYRHDNLLRDACSGIPLKMPPQQALQEESEAAATSTTETPRSNHEGDADKSSSGKSQALRTIFALLYIKKNLLSVPASRSMHVYFQAAEYLWVAYFREYA